MEFFLLDGWKPAFVFYWDRVVRMGAVTVGPFIFMKEKYKDDTSRVTLGLMEHEFTHTRQFYDPRKWFAGKLAWEVEAYKVQAAIVPENINVFAWYIAHKYGLDITQEEALKLLEA